MDNYELIKEANNNLINSYSPYSKFKVSAALLTTDGRIFKGVNVENISFGLTNCAERSAIFNAVSNGCTRFHKIAIVNSKGTKCVPCGACLQVLSEFCDNSFMIILEDSEGVYEYTLEDLLPNSFKEEL